jgi:hypothetical protein
MAADKNIRIDAKTYALLRKLKYLTGKTIKELLRDLVAKAAK